jgi:hypothetical protein
LIRFFPHTAQRALGAADAVVATVAATNASATQSAVVARVNAIVLLIRLLLVARSGDIVDRPGLVPV